MSFFLTDLMGCWQDCPDCKGAGGNYVSVPVPGTMAFDVHLEYVKCACNGNTSPLFLREYKVLYGAKISVAFDSKKMYTINKG